MFAECSSKSVLCRSWFCSCCCWAQLPHDSEWTRCTRRILEAFLQASVQMAQTHGTESTSSRHGLQVKRHLLLGCMAPDLEAKRPSSTKEGSLLANVIAAHHKQCFALLSMSLTHDLHQGGYCVVLHPPATLLLSTQVCRAV